MEAPNQCDPSFYAPPLMTSSVESDVGEEIGYGGLRTSHTASHPLPSAPPLEVHQDVMNEVEEEEILFGKKEMPSFVSFNPPPMATIRMPSRPPSGMLQTAQPRQDYHLMLMARERGFTPTAVPGSIWICVVSCQGLPVRQDGKDIRVQLSIECDGVSISSKRVAVNSESAEAHFYLEAVANPQSSRIITLGLSSVNAGQLFRHASLGQAKLDTSGALVGDTLCAWGPMPNQTLRVVWRVSLNAPLCRPPIAMSALPTLRIVTERSVYFPGEVVRGLLSLSVRGGPKRVTDVQLRASCCVSVHSHVSGAHVKHFWDSFSLFESFATLWRGSQLPPGIHCSKFQFRLPANTPRTGGRIMYPYCGLRISCHLEARARLASGMNRIRFAYKNIALCRRNHILAAHVVLHQKEKSFAFNKGSLVVKAGLVDPHIPLFLQRKPATFTLRLHVANKHAKKGISSIKLYVDMETTAVAKQVRKTSCTTWSHRSLKPNIAAGSQWASDEQMSLTVPSTLLPHAGKLSSIEVTLGGTVIASIAYKVRIVVKCGMSSVTVVVPIEVAAQDDASVKDVPVPIALDYNPSVRVDADFSNVELQMAPGEISANENFFATDGVLKLGSKWEYNRSENLSANSSAIVAIVNDIDWAVMRRKRWLSNKG